MATLNRQRGSDRYNAKLTAEDVREIRRLGGTIKDAAIAAEFGVSEGNVGHILKGRTWKHVDMPWKKKPQADKLAA